MKDNSAKRPEAKASRGQGRKTYTRPELTRFGLVRDLTAGGSGQASESSNPDDNASPGNPDATKPRP